jgi:hypothetical protein
MGTTHRTHSRFLFSLLQALLGALSSIWVLYKQGHDKKDKLIVVKYKAKLD